MIAPTFDKDGDPTEETLQAIGDWDYEGEAHRLLLAFVRDAWNQECGKVEVFDPAPTEDDNERWVFVTGGWHANELLADALMGNVMFRASRWYQSTAGGKYEFHIWKKADL